MPVYVMQCRACLHEFRNLVREGERQPVRWECLACGASDVGPKPGAPAVEYAWEKSHPAGCACCVRYDPPRLGALRMERTRERDR